MNCKLKIFVDNVSPSEIRQVAHGLALDVRDVVIEGTRACGMYDAVLRKESQEVLFQFRTVRDLARYFPVDRHRTIAVTFIYECDGPYDCRAYWASLNASRPAQFKYK